MVFRIGTKRHYCKTIKYYHGSNGVGSPSSVNRQASIYVDADVVVNGHSHVSWHQPIIRERVTERGVVRREIQHHVRTASYLDEYGDGSGGFEVEKGKKPNPMGAVFLTLVYRNNDIEFEVNQAVE